MRLPIKPAVGILFLLVALGTTWWLWRDPASPRWAPDVTFTTLAGEEIPLHSLRGRPVLVMFWASTCASCRKEMPHLAAMYQALGGSGFEMIGVAMSYDPPNRVLELVRKQQLPYPVALDLDGAVAAAFGNVRLTPTSFLIAQNGRIVEREAGKMDLPRLRRQVEALLPERAPVARLEGGKARRLPLPGRLLPPGGAPVAGIGRGQQALRPAPAAPG